MRALKLLLIGASLACSACGTTGDTLEEAEPVLVEHEPALTPEPETSPPGASDERSIEGEVPLAVAESEQPEIDASADELEEVIVEAPRGRH
jgi:hypothetical protein